MKSKWEFDRDAHPERCESKVRPVATFALLAYNQESFVQSAIEGAFAQTYEPLQIVLSDDNSKDRTFDVMQDMAASYRGPHKLVVNRPEKNLGVFRHVLDVAAKCEGDLIIGAAGDDISLPHRVATAVAAWRQTGAYAICSSFDRIDQTGAVIERNVNPRELSVASEKWFYPEPKNPVSPLWGATACYDRNVFRYMHNTDMRIEFEDIITSYVISKLRKSIFYIDESLLLYRVHGDALVSRPSTINSTIVENENHGFRINRSNIEMLKYLIELEDNFLQNRGADLRRVNRSALVADLRVSKLKVAWTLMGTLERMRSLIIDSYDLSEIRWKAARLFGKNPNYMPVTTVKKVIMYIRGIVSGFKRSTG